MEEPMTLEQFRQEHPNDVTQQISAGYTGEQSFSDSFARVAARVPLCRVFPIGMA